MNFFTWKKVPWVGKKTRKKNQCHKERQVLFGLNQLRVLGHGCIYSCTRMWNKSQMKCVELCIGPTIFTDKTIKWRLFCWSLYKCHISKFKLSDFIMLMSFIWLNIKYEWFKRYFIVDFWVSFPGSQISTVWVGTWT